MAEPDSTAEVEGQPAYVDATDDSAESVHGSSDGEAPPEKPRRRLVAELLEVHQEKQSVAAEEAGGPPVEIEADDAIEAVYELELDTTETVAPSTTSATPDQEAGAVAPGGIAAGADAAAIAVDAAEVPLAPIVEGEPGIATASPQPAPTTGPASGAFAAVIGPPPGARAAEPTEQEPVVEIVVEPPMGDPLAELGIQSAVGEPALDLDGDASFAALTISPEETIIDFGLGSEMQEPVIEVGAAPSSAGLGEPSDDAVPPTSLRTDSAVPLAGESSLDSAIDAPASMSDEMVATTSPIAPKTTAPLTPPVEGPSTPMADASATPIPEAPRTPPMGALPTPEAASMPTSGRSFGQPTVSAPDFGAQDALTEATDAPAAAPAWSPAEGPAEDDPGVGYPPEVESELPVAVPVAGHVAGDRSADANDSSAPFLAESPTLHNALKWLIAERDRQVMAAERDGISAYELAASIDAFVDAVVRTVREHDA